MDGDGDADVMSASFNDYEVAWYENRLEEPSADFGPQQLLATPDGAFVVCAQDLDGDRDPDVISGAILADEVAWYENPGSDPTDADSNDDGLCDGGPPGTAPECTLGGEDTNGNGVYDVGTETDPGNPDTDGDGFSDGQEVAAAGNPLDALDVPGPLVPALPLAGWALLGAALLGMGPRASCLAVVKK